MNVGKPVMPALELKGELLVVDPHHVKNSRMKIMDAYGVFGNIVAEIIRLPLTHSRIRSTARHEHAKTARMMISTIGFVSQFILAIHRPAKLPSPNYKRIL